MNLNKNVCVLVNTCDSYSDLWPLFAESFMEFWPNRSIQVHFNTERIKEFNYKNFDIIFHNSNSKYWGERLLQTLDNISTEYVFMLFDDFIIDNKFDDSVLNEVIQEMNSDKSISVFYLDAIGLPSNKMKNKLDKFELILPDSEYRLNSAPAIWRKDDLKKYTGVKDTPWAWEVFGTYKTQNSKKIFYQPISKQFFPFDGSQGGAIYRGKWVKSVVIHKVEKYQLDLDLSKRGFASKPQNESRSLSWKINFLWIGWKMVKFKIFKFIFIALKKKF